MKKITGFVLALVLSSSALANDKDDILELCSIAKKGNFSQIQAKGLLQADGSIKLATLGGKGEVSFRKGSWDGIQQVLKDHQATDNVTARDCVIRLMPYFKSKVKGVKAASKPNNKTVKKQSAPEKQRIADVKPVAKSAANIDVKASDKSPVQIGDHNSVSYQ